MNSKGLIVAALHIALVCSLGAKLLFDRATLPRGWVRSIPVDPNLPIRGRYVSLHLSFPYEGPGKRYETVALRVKDDRVVAHPAERGLPARIRNGEAVLTERVAYFIPEDIPDPSIRARDEELWVEVLVPRKGSPRPVRLGVMKDGRIEPLAID